MNFLEKYGLKLILIFILLVSYSITAQSKTLLILGDSISAGYGIKEADNWVTLLQKNYAARDLDIKIINSSISGDTTIGGLGRIKRDLSLFSPSHILIELGGNDALRGYPIDSIKKNLSTTIELIKKNDSLPILMQIRIPPNYGKRYVEAFEKIYRELSIEQDIPLVEFMLENIALNKDLMQLDGIHPNQKAQILIASEVQKSLAKIIENP